MRRWKPDDGTLYKFLGAERESVNGGKGRWTLGRWRSARGELVPCKNGLHLCRVPDLLLWCAPTLWVAETEGERVDCDDKVVVRRARITARVETWTDTTARLFAADCAERVLPIFERAHPTDDRPREAIRMARLYARGECDDAARDAAWAAARAAAWAAAGAAAWAAAGDAAGDAAWAAAGAAAWDAAGDAARAAARAAAWDAAGDAAGDAERHWQMQRLMEYLRGELK